MTNAVSKSLFVIFLLLAACNHKGNKTNRKGYEITGHVKNIVASRVYMNTMVLDSAGQPKWVIIDSADYANETFILKRDTSLIEPAWATGIFYIDSLTKKKIYLSFNNKYSSAKDMPSRYVSFILENAAITIEGDMNDKNGLKLEGAKETDFNFQYGLMQPPSNIYIINRKIDSAKQAPDTSVLAAYRTQKYNLLQGYKTNFKKIISRHPTYFEALSNIYQNANYFTPDELQTLAGLLDKKLLLLPTGKKLAEFIEQEKKLLPGSIFPDFNYMDTTGKKITLQNVKGQKATLIVFWASWCGPCRAEIPELKKLYEQYNAKGISIVSISVDNNINSWTKALLKEKMQWPNLSNLPGNYEEIYSKYNIKAIPLMFLLDSNNKILLANPSTVESVKDQIKQEVPKVQRD